MLTLFRIVAIGEALSWLGLLVGMAFKYSGNGEAGVHLFGPIHGGMFVAYVMVTLAAGSALKWSTRFQLLALAAAVPPFATLLVERRVRPAFGSSGLQNVTRSPRQ